MNTQKSVYNRLFSKVEKTELESQKIELSLIDDAKKLTSVYYGKTDSANGKLKALASESRSIISIIDDALKAADKMPSLISKLETMAKDLGIKVKIEELESMKNAVKESKEYKDYKKKLENL